MPLGICLHLFYGYKPFFDTCTRLMTDRPDRGSLISASRLPFRFAFDVLD